MSPIMTDSIMSCIRNSVGVRILAAAAVALAIALGASPAQATTITFEVNTTSLVGHPAGPFSLDFQLNDGSGTGDANNTATLTGFDLGGGTAGGVTTLGGASGDISTGVSIVDSGFINDFTQVFTAGSYLRFTLSFTTFLDGEVPDLFTFAILAASGFPIPTTEPGDPGFDTFISINLDSRDPAVLVYSSDTTRDPTLDVSIRTVTEDQTAVPEPSSLAILGAATIALARRRRRRYSS
jgi:hypothetical protein